jgi:lactate dehydrogenase-like 2-hydroxyacid dehydrogenase
MPIQCLFLNDREPYPEDCFDAIPGIQVTWVQDHRGGFSLVDALDAHPDTEVLITTLMALSAENLARLPRLRRIVTITTSTDFIDKDYCERNGIEIHNTPGFTGASVAEHAMALMLAAAKRLRDYDSGVRRGDFQVFEHQGIELAGRTAGIIGMGAIGSQVARMLAGFDMRVLFCNRRPRQSDLATQVDLEQLLAQSDILFLTLSMSPEARHLINAETLALVKPGAILVNISPDGLIDADALKDALETGRLAYAGLDLHHQDPRFAALPNCILSPRRAWYTQEAFTRRIQCFTRALAEAVQSL